MDDEIVVPHDPALSVASAFTISALFEVAPGAISGTHRIISKEASGSNDNFFLALGGGTLFFGVEGNFLAPPILFEDARWYHVAASFDDAANRVQIFVDGVQVLSQTLNASITPNTDPVYIGSSWQGTKVFEGLLDEIRLYDYALASEQVSALSEEAVTAVADPAFGGGDALRSTDCTGDFADYFGAVGYAGQDGSLAWSTDWLEISESDGPDRGDERVLSADGGGYELRVADNDGGGEGVEREADLSAHATAILGFEYRRSSFDNASDFVTVDVSSDGGASWRELARFSGPGSDSVNQVASYDISPEIARDTRIRFLTSDRLGGSDRLYLDAIRIAVSGCASQ